MEEEQTLQQVSNQALKAEKKQKSRNRIFVLLIVVDVCLLALFVYELVVLFSK